MTSEEHKKYAYCENENNQNVLFYNFVQIESPGKIIDTIIRCLAFYQWYKII